MFIQSILSCVLFGLCCSSFAFFFFKQKTAYDIMPSLVGSEMCIRDRNNRAPVGAFPGGAGATPRLHEVEEGSTEMIGFNLTEEQSVFKQAAREFAENQMKPYAAELDRREQTFFDPGIVQRFADARLLGLPIPAEYGGAGVDYLTAAIVSEELGAGCAGMTVVAGTTWLAVISIMLVGSEEQKERYLPRICEPAGKLAALASTEAEAGSDISAMETLAVRTGDSYVLNGRKHYITNAGLADFYVVFATTNPSKRHAGINAFIVDGDSSGLSVGRTEDKMGLRASRNAELVLEDVEVPAGNLLGEEGTGFLVLMQTLDTSRPCLGAISVGLARAAYEAALSYARQRRQYGRLLIENQGVSFMLADMATAIDAARLLTLSLIHI